MQTLKLYLAARRKRLRRRDITWGQREEPDTKQSTIAMLSQSRRMRRVRHCLPQAAAVSMIG